VWVSMLTLAAVVVMIAVVITVPTMMRSPQIRPLAPGLAALNGAELAALLPETVEFPTGWDVEESPTPSDVFGSAVQTGVSSSPMGKCFALLTRSRAAAPFAAAGLLAHSPEDPEHLDPGLRLTVHREFDTATLDRHATLAADCASFGDETMHWTVTVLERDLQHLRFTLTRVDEVDQPPAQTRYFSYARHSGLLVIGQIDGNYPRVLDTLMSSTLGRIAAR